MARVVCTLPNAGALINGVRFASVDGGMLSEDIPDDMAVGFASIRGYRIWEPPVIEKKASVGRPAASHKEQD